VESALNGTYDKHKWEKRGQEEVKEEEKGVRSLFNLQNRIFGLLMRFSF
jgi:hypothetical protein